MSEPVASTGHASQGPLNPDDVPWKKIWSLQEMRDSSKNWNLSSDAGLLNYMQDFANRLIYKTKELENQVDGLVQDSKSAYVKVHNTFDQFLMLSNVQFIENRVYEINEDSVIQVEDTSNKNEKEEITEEILIPKFSKAIILGLAALEKSNNMNAAMESSEASSFNDLNSAGVSTGDPNLLGGDGEQAQQAIQKKEKLEHYLRYPLPHIIGSQQFRDDDFVGLFIEESDTEEDAEDLEESDDEDSSDIDGEELGKENKADDTSFLTDDQSSTKQQSFFFQEEGEDKKSTSGKGLGSSTGQDAGSSSLFEDDDIFDNGENKKKPSTSLYTSNLDDILGDDMDLFSDKKKDKSTTGGGSSGIDLFNDDIISNKSKKDDDNGGDLFSTSNNSGLTDKPKKKSFLMDDDDDDLFKSAPSKGKSESSSSKKSVSFDEEALFDTPTTTSKSNLSAPSGKKTLNDLFSSNFGEDEIVSNKKESTSVSNKKTMNFLLDGEDDLFSGESKPKATSSNISTIANSDTEKDLSDKEGNNSSSSKKKPVGGVKLFDFGSDNSEMFSKAKGKSSTTVASLVSDEDFFSGSKDNKTKGSETSEIFGNNGSLLDKAEVSKKRHVSKKFEGDVLGIDDITTIKDSKSKSKDVFSIGNDDLPIPSPPKEQQQLVTPEPPKDDIVVQEELSKPIKSSKPKKNNFFDEVDSTTPSSLKADELFDQSTQDKPTKSSKPKKNNFFEEIDTPLKSETTSLKSDNEESLFSGVKSKPKDEVIIEEPIKSTVSSKPKKNNFFEEVDSPTPLKTESNEESLFSGITKPKDTEKPSTKSSSKDFFSSLDSPEPSNISTTSTTKKNNNFFDFDSPKNEKKPTSTKENSLFESESPLIIPKKEKKEKVVVVEQPQQSVLSELPVFESHNNNTNISPPPVPIKEDLQPVTNKPRAKSIGSMFEAQLQEKEKEKEKVKDDKDKSGKLKNSNISSLQNRLSLNPNMFMPGAKNPLLKKKRETDSESESGSNNDIDSDTSVESHSETNSNSSRSRALSVSTQSTTTSIKDDDDDNDDNDQDTKELEHTTKSRPKMGGRRLPSRRGRSNTVSSASPSSTRSESLGSSRLSSANRKSSFSSSESESEKPKASPSPSPKSSNSSIPITPSGGSILDILPTTATLAPLKGGSSSSVIKSESEDEKITSTPVVVSTKPKKPSATESKKSKATGTSSNVDSIFDNIPEVPKSTSKKSSKSTTTTKPATIKKQSSSSNLTKESNGKATVDSLFDGIDTTGGKSKKSQTKAADNLFGEVTPSKPTTSKSKSTSKSSAKSKSGSSNVVENLFD